MGGDLPSPGLDGRSLRLFHAALAQWFSNAGRSFPWRRTRDPYKVLVAEKLLQQTAARDALVQAYQGIIHKFPTPKDLAEARLSDIQWLMRPLGLTYRARELRALAREVVTKYNARVPDDLKALMALPGVGDYSSRAVMSFAFHKDVAVVDTNVARFLHRMFGISSPLPENPSRLRALRKLAESLVPAGRARTHNLAVLDLCALVCRPTNPLC